MQNKDTGDLPLLHVYELDPLPLDAYPECENTGSGNAEETNGDEKSGKAEEIPGDKRLSDESHVDENRDVEKVAPLSVVVDTPVRAEIDALSDETISDDQKSDDAGPKYSFLAIAQRRSEVVSRDVLHPFSHRVFGTPVLLRVHELESFTGRSLYDLVAKRLRNFVPKAALRFLMNDSASEKAEGDATEENGEHREKTRSRTRERQLQTLSDMEDVSAGPVPRYGFRLRIATRDGRRCALCPWYECCIGCLVPDDDNPTIVMCGDSVALDWHFAVDIATSGFGLRTNQPDQSPNHVAQRSRIPSIPIKNHSSCGSGAKKRGCTGATTLEDCLEEFAREERIPEVSLQTSILQSFTRLNLYLHVFIS